MNNARFKILYRKTDQGESMRWSLMCFAGVLVAIAAAPSGALAAVELRGSMRATFSAASVRVPGGTYVALSGSMGTDRRSAAVLRIVRVAASGEQRDVPSPPAEPDGTVRMTRLGDEPCVRLTSRGSPYVACLRGDAWQELRFTGRRRLLGLGNVERCWDTVCALLTGGAGGKRVSREVVRWTPGGWVSVEPALPRWPVAITGLGVPVSAASDVGPPLVGVVHGPHRARRRVLGLRDGAWTDAVVPHQGDFGALNTGPVVAGHAIYMTLSDFAHEPWPFGLLRWTVGGRARRALLSRGFGNAQGEPAVVAGQLWVAWQEQRRSGDPAVGLLSDTEYWVARLDPVTLRVQRRLRLWSGTTVHPFSVRVVDVDGHPYALWIRSRWRGGRPTLRPDRDLTTTAMLESLDAR